MKRAVFLDRDGVLVKDVDVLTRPEQLRLYEETPRALAQLKALGFTLVVVTNQPVVARGLATEEAIEDIHRALRGMAPELDAFYVCPHHPNATLDAFRVDCDCRKPAPGLLLRAGIEMGIDLATSYFIGDRATDVLAGRRAGCHTIQIATGKHDAPSIEVAPRWVGSVGSAEPDARCANVEEAAGYIARRERRT